MEARRNLTTPDQQADLDDLLNAVTVLPVSSGREDPRVAGIPLPDKDRPILQAAVEGQATHLLTGDVHHSGPYYGQRLAGVLILPPAAYLKTVKREPDV
jgi:hypothetical protein